MPYAPVNGLEMYYELHGDGPPLLLLHSGSSMIPDAWIPYFSPHFRVIAIEQMGHGRTGDNLARAFHHHDMAEDTAQLMQHLGIAAAAVVGSSDGGIIGLDLAIHHPERITKLALTGANIRVEGLTESGRDFLRNLGPENDPVPEGYARMSPDGAAHWPEFLERLKPLWLNQPAYTHAEMSAIQAPTLLIFGDHDIITLEHAVEMFRAIPNAQLCVMPHAEHGVLPREVVVNFLLDQPEPKA